MKMTLAGFLATACLALYGCTAATSIQFDYKPRPLTLASADASAPPALVLGQAYMRGYGDWVQLIISSVDETQTLSAVQLRPDINFLVPAGKRTLRVKVQLGNSMSWKELQVDPELDVELSEGAVYQVKAREATNIRGETDVDLWIERLGTIQEYERFIQRHPDYKQGQPLTAGEMAAS